MPTAATLPRAEYPRPQFVRTDAATAAPIYLCLNGEWDFEIDAGDSGIERGFTLPDATFSKTITVPFCPESDLSGVGHKDFMNAVWYRKTVTLPSEWAGKAAIVHFQAVDYDATVWAITPATNGKAVELVRHRGGFTPFSASLLGLADGGDEITLILRARDPARNVAQPRGKQASQFAPHGCHYTRTTGIWQTVWMEATPVPAAFRRPRITPDVAAGAFRLEVPLTNNPKGYRIHAVVSDGNGTVAEANVRADLDLSPRLDLMIPADRQRLWGTKDPFLYDLTLTLLDSAGNPVDRIESYAGLRSVSIDGKKVRINGESVFQRLVLDQGYYIDGVMTAPSEEALIADIKLSMDAGFNGARLHQKVFEERFLYHADRLGYLCWGEFADWGCSGYGPNHDHQQPGVTYVAQWLEAVERDYSHPSIVGWCPLNETWQDLTDRITILDDTTRAMFLAAKALDTSRPVLDTSGYAHRVIETDIYDSHDYIEDKDFEAGLTKFRERHEGTPDWKAFLNPHGSEPGPGKRTFSVPYKGQPYFVSEFGGFKWNPEIAAKSATENSINRKTSWGYGSDPQSLEDFYARFEGTCATLLQNEFMFGYCYTQLTDVYPEENGIYGFDRSVKFDNARLREIQERIAAIEDGE